ncbi:helix-turn-helix domain-containing protein [Devosia sp. MC1541]|uniref:helix-turn-helix domain-containing protein n=1 Tax=Devosia sp. MC1541 TaxID=2725264 RepID=UPI00145CD980|nr:helix-turn-helix domain-containing protein [Devosia sp. MC1541]
MNAIAMEHLARRKRLGMEPAKPVVRALIVSDRELEQVVGKMVAGITLKSVDAKIVELLEGRSDARLSGVVERAIRAGYRRELTRLHELRRENDRLERANEAPSQKTASVDGIIEAVALAHGFTVAEMLSAQQSQPVVRARQEAMYRLSTETSLSRAGIGRRLGGKDHTTVIHGIKQHKKRMEAQQP